MAKRKRCYTRAVHQRKLKEGRGLGTGASFRGWYNVHDVASRGVCHRVRPTWTDIGRELHVMSNLERGWLFVFDWSESVIDIREQFPLHPVELTIEIAEQCGVRHPMEHRGDANQPIPLTTDFLLTIAGPLHPTYQARTIKYSEELSNRRVLEKFEMERRFWERQGVSWAVLTERELPTILVRNLEILRTVKSLEGRLHISPEKLFAIANDLTEGVSEQCVPLRVITSRLETKHNMPPGSCLTIAYHLISNRLWQVDLHTPLDPSRPLSLLGHAIHGLSH